ncbi:unknown [Clostridium sp. CAG:149]|nr:unknown [Clostridium sp. CAG:149]
MGVQIQDQRAQKRRKLPAVLKLPGDLKIGDKGLYGKAGPLLLPKVQQSLQKRNPLVFQLSTRKIVRIDKPDEDTGLLHDRVEAELCRGHGASDRIGNGIVIGENIQVGNVRVLIPFQAVR